MKTNILDDVKKIKKIDQGHVADSIELLPEQIKQVLHEANSIKVPASYKKINKVVVNGMGGSSLGAYIIKAALSDKLKVPIEVVSDYNVPAYVDSNTLYVVCSYSGTTEEPLSTYIEAKKRKAKIMAVTEHSTKSKLEALMKKDKVPGYIFTPKNNPSDQPRLGVGYTVFGIITILAKVGLFKLSPKEIGDIIKTMKKWGKDFAVEKPISKNAAKKIIVQLKDKMPILAAGGFLAGNLHTLRNQINECGKNYSSYLVLPDLNHYAMEGLVYPKTNKKDIAFLFFDSKLYHERVQLRAKLTKQVVKKNGIDVLAYSLRGKTKLEQAFELLQFGSWLSYYLGMQNNVDPVKIPWVDWFKKELDKK